MSDDTTVIEDICRQRLPGKSRVVGGLIVGVAPEKECRVDTTHGTPQPAAPEPRRRKQKPFRAELGCVTSDNPWEPYVRLKVKLDRATFENFVKLAAEQNRTAESLLRQCLVRAAKAWNKKAKATHDHD
jgi:hypothetical protein